MHCGKRCQHFTSSKKIIFGKLLNCGQTCVAPDYVLIHKEKKKEFIQACKKYITQFIGTNWKENKEYPKMINERHFQRVVSLLENEDVIYGGKYDAKILKIQPTLLDIHDKSTKVMQEEIFGPILPMIEYENLEEVIHYINSNEKPLALYLFISNKKTEKRILKEVSFGGVGYSGMGEYHGKHSFKTFSHYKSILKKSTLIDLPMRYHPYKKLNDKLNRMFMK